MSTSNNRNLNKGNQDLIDKYGVFIDENGVMTKGTATDRDYEIANTIYGSRQSGALLDEQEKKNQQTYAGTLEEYRLAADRMGESLGVQREQTKRETSVMLDKLSRYLPALQRLEGTTGSGTAETTSLQAYNEALNRMNQADRDYTAGVQSAEDTYTTNKLTLDEAKLAADTELANQRAALMQSTNNSLQEAYGRFAQEDEEKAKAQQENIFAVVSDELGNRVDRMLTSNSDELISQAEYDELAAYVESQREQVGKENAALLDLMLDSYRDNYLRTETEQKEFDIESGSTEIYRPGFGGKLKINGKAVKGRNIMVVEPDANWATQKGVYETEIVEIVDDTSIKLLAEDVQEGEVFTVGDQVYIKLPGSKKVKAGTIARLGTKDIAKIYNSILKTQSSSQTNQNKNATNQVVQNQSATNQTQKKESSQNTLQKYKDAWNALFNYLNE